MRQTTKTRRRASWKVPVAVAALLLAVGACEVPTALPRVESTFRFPIDSVVVPVAGVAASASEQSDLSDIDLSDRVRGAVLRVTPVNAAGAQGQLTIEIRGGGVVVTGAVDVAEPATREIAITEAEARALLSGMITMTASGTLCRASGCGLAPPPFPTVTLKNELEILLELGGEGR